MDGPGAGAAGAVAGIWLCGAGGEPMRSVPSAEAAAGEGLLGDRYQRGTGHWAYDARLRNDVTLVAEEDLAAAGAEFGVALGGGASRRNVVTTGVDPAALVGREFWIGGALLRGDRPCDPCRYLDGLLGGPAKAALTGRGGLRATVTRSGTLAVGDALVLVEVAGVVDTLDTVDLGEDGAPPARAPRG